MKRIALVCIGSLGAALLVLGVAPTASAYPELTCDLTVDKQVVSSGETFTATGTSQIADDERGAASDNTWTFEFHGATKRRNGATASVKLKAPKVTQTSTFTLTGRVDTPQGSCERQIDITVGGSAVAGPTTVGGTAVGGTAVAGPTDGGLLPNTGGPQFWLLVAALVLLLGGSVLVFKRRQS